MCRISTFDKYRIVAIGSEANPKRRHESKQQIYDKIPIISQQLLCKFPINLSR